MHYPLSIAPERFIEAYNLDISPYIERHKFKESAQKTGNEINYLSYSHAYRLFRTYFPELDVANQENDETKGFIFREIDERGYFTKPYVYKVDGETGIVHSSPYYYYPVLTVSGLAVYPNEPATKKDYKTGAVSPVPGQYVADIQLFNKSVQRGLVKAIALTTGIGLKLWTGEDLDETLVDEKFKLLDHLHKLANEYNASNPPSLYKVASSYLDTITTITAEGKAIRTLLNSLQNSVTVNGEIVDTESKPVVEKFTGKELPALPSASLTKKK